LACGANVDATNEQGRTALHCAAARGHLDALLLLWDHGADVNLRDEDGKTALQLGVTCGHSKALEQSNLWPAAPADVHWTDISQRRLRTCARAGDLEGVREQLAMGVNVLSTDEERNSAIDLAKRAGHATIATYLEHVAAAQRWKRRYAPEPPMQPTNRDSHERAVRESGAKYEAAVQQHQRDLERHQRSQPQYLPGPSTHPHGRLSYEDALEQYQRNKKHYDQVVYPAYLAARRQLHPARAAAN